MLLDLLHPDIVYSDKQSRNESYSQSAVQDLKDDGTAERFVGDDENRAHTDDSQSDGDVSSDTVIHAKVMSDVGCEL